MIYKEEDLIDLEKIRNILDNNKEKKLICFGGGTASAILNRILLNKYQVYCYLDNNKDLWNTTINNVPINSPEIVKELKKGTFCILILSQHLINISNQLNDYGLKKNEDYFDIYSEFKKYFRIQKFEDSMNKFISFIDKSPDDILINCKKIENPKSNNQQIGVVCIGSMINWETWYAIAIYLMLLRKGYNAALIVDQLNGFEDYIYFNDYSVITKKYIEYILDYLQNKFGKLDIRYIDANKEAKLTDEDIEEGKRLARINVIWQYSKMDDLVGISDEERYVKFEEIILRNMKNIKYFFDNNSFDTINVISALHKHRGIYLWEGLKRNIRVSNYDGMGASKKAVFETHKPVSHSFDIRKVVKENYFTENEKEKLIEKSKELFYKRCHSTVKDAGYNYQLTTELNENQKFYDIVMPLNVCCDGAALGQDRIFYTYKQWLFETVEFILNNTSATLMVREHPAQLVAKDEIFYNFKEEMDIKFGENPRLYYCQPEEKINTYHILEKCKVVLPYATTVGIEAAIMGKRVITHTSCYYADMGFVDNAMDKEDYFKKIQDALITEYTITPREKDIAYLTYICQMKHATDSEFREACDDWMYSDLDTLLETAGVKKIMGIVAEDIPAVYTNCLELINS